VSGNILEVKNLKVHFPVKGELIPKNVGYVKAVDGISFNIGYAETLGLVGESGCGKSTTGRAVLNMLKVDSGQVFFEGKDILKSSRKELKKIRRDMQLIFQDPFGSLNPRMTIGSALEEVLYIHHIRDKNERQKRVIELIEMVGLNKNYLSRYPHEFSGGQRQRAVIARALAVKPKFIVCDEPVSALDVSIQSQIINLLEELQKNFKLTYLFIAHDLSVVKHISNRIAVMYLGRIVEIAESDELFKRPAHPYTKALLSSIPVCDPDFRKNIILLEGDLPSPANPPKGCRFHTRCIYVREDCSRKEPVSVNLGNGHMVECHLYSNEEED
jgi:oligopeptide/dipeptide ABC transporter ATP-binding protein